MYFSSAKTTTFQVATYNKYRDKYWSIIWKDHLRLWVKHDTTCSDSDQSVNKENFSMRCKAICKYSFYTSFTLPY